MKTIYLHRNKINNKVLSYEDAIDLGWDIVRGNSPILIDILEYEDLFSHPNDKIQIVFEK